MTAGLKCNCPQCGATNRLCPAAEELEDILAQAQRKQQAREEDVLTLRAQLAEAQESAKLAQFCPQCGTHWQVLTTAAETLEAERVARQQAERERDEARARARNHHLEACVSCAVTESQRDRALAALRAVEWVEYDIWRCAWCGEHKTVGHKAGCLRQIVLRETEGS